MAKTPKVKKREVSLHSRAARRNASPPPKDSSKASKIEKTEYKPWLHNAQNAGISKKKKTKTLTRQQRMRQQRGMEKADATVEKLEKKVADSKKRSKKIQQRAVEWEELNEKIEGKKKTRPEGGANGEKMEDIVLPDLEQPLPIRTAEMDGVEEQPAPAGEQQLAGAEKVPLPEADEDEVL